MAVELRRVCFDRHDPSFGIKLPLLCCCSIRRVLRDMLCAGDCRLMLEAGKVHQHRIGLSLCIGSPQPLLGYGTILFKSMSSSKRMALFFFHSGYSDQSVLFFDSVLKIRRRCRTPTNPSHRSVEQIEDAGDYPNGQTPLVFQAIKTSRSSRHCSHRSSHRGSRRGSPGSPPTPTS